MIPQLSVVIPVYNSAAELERCLAGLSRSEVSPAECIVVDDCSTDNSARVATLYGAKILSTQGRSGPAKARNIGAKTANGDIIFFLDADVCVRPDTITKIIAEFTNDPELDAVMGSYDRAPAAMDFVSQYRNLMHSFVHHSSNRKATTFWSGCGAVRRQVFLDFGGFDENHFHAPAIEDVELGYRLSNANRKLALNPDIQVKHLKRWSLRNMISTDFFRRAVPWSELAIRSGRMPNDLNLRISQRISVVLVFLLGLLAVYQTIRWSVYFLTPLLAVFFLLLSVRWINPELDRSHFVTAWMLALLGVIAFLSYRFNMFGMVPLLLVAWFALLTRHRYAYAREKWRRWTGVLVGGYILCVIAWVTVYLPKSPLKFLFVVGLVTLVILNKQFYVFLGAARGNFFALAAIPFHLLYFVYCGAAFMLVMVRHSLGRLFGSSDKITNIVPPVEEVKVKATAR